jgi:hypothetical protein
MLEVPKALNTYILLVKILKMLQWIISRKPTQTLISMLLGSSETICKANNLNLKE